MGNMNRLVIRMSVWQSVETAADDVVQLATECGGTGAGGRARAVVEEQAGALAGRLRDLEQRALDARDALAGATAAVAQFQVTFHIVLRISIKYGSQFGTNSL
jgi:hypothetical protein